MRKFVVPTTTVKVAVEQARGERVVMAAAATEEADRDTVAV